MALKPKLMMLLLGCKPKDRHIEQHDIFFTIGKDLQSVVPDIEAFWPDGGRVHIDAWQNVTHCNGYKVEIVRRKKQNNLSKEIQLFFINLGGYKPGEFEEYHYKMLIAAKDKAAAIKKAKASAFYMHTGFKGAASHIDDQYGVDVDDFFKVDDILPDALKQHYQIKLTPTKAAVTDPLQIGYINLSKIK
jgi:hypothetical protein